MWSPQPGSASQRLQSPMPILHLDFFQKPHSSEQAPQSSAQLAQVSPSAASQLPSSLQTKAELSQSTPTSAQEAASPSTTSLVNPRARAASTVPRQASAKV